MDAREQIDKILKAKKCGDYFETRDENAIRTEYRQAVMAIHPDICNDPRAGEAFVMLQKFHKRALECLKENTWEETDILRIKGMAPARYRDETVTELGRRYTADDQVIWTFDPGKEKFLKRYSLTARSIRYADDRMRKTYRERMPRIIKETDSAIAVKKKPNEYPMDLFLKAYGEKLDMKDIAWMVSRMCDLVCFLCYGTNRMALNGIEPKNLFVDPEDHIICLYGGWQYAAGISEKMIGTSKELYSAMPLDARNTKLATTVTDVESVRIMFQKVCRGKDIPKPIAGWLDAGSTDNPMKEYARWTDAVEEAWGPRKFRVFSAKADEIYSQP